MQHRFTMLCCYSLAGGKKLLISSSRGALIIKLLTMLYNLVLLLPMYILLVLVNLYSYFYIQHPASKGRK